MNRNEGVGVSIIQYDFNKIAKIILFSSFGSNCINNFD